MVSTLISSFGSKLELETSVARSPTGEPLLEADEAIKLTATSVSVTLGSGSDAGAGTLYITTRRVIWTSASQPEAALGLRYQQIVMHAISRDTSSFPRPCIYLQLDSGSEDMRQQEDGEEEEEEEAEAPVEAEIRLIPEDAAKVEEIFVALCDCAALNPDPQEEGEGDFYFDEDEVLGGLDDQARAALLARQAAGMELEEGAGELGELVGEDPGRFEDDDEEEEGHGNGNMHE